jgi:putative ABC transport system permease protein
LKDRQQEQKKRQQFTTEDEIMFSNYLVSALRNLGKYKLDSFINIAGLTIGLATTLMIGLFVIFETSYDGFWQHADRIHRVNTIFNSPGRDPLMTASAPPVAPALADYFPNEIKQVSRALRFTSTLGTGSEFFREKVAFVDQSFVEMFAFDVISGDIRSALQDVSRLIIDETAARKYFGANDPLGKVLTLSNRSFTRDYTIAAVIRDIPSNSHLSVGIMALFVDADFAEIGQHDGNWYGTMRDTYFLLNENVNPSLVTSRLDEMVDLKWPFDLDPSFERASQFYELYTTPVTEIYLEAKNGERRQIVIAFAIIAALILIVAGFNFVNLATARTVVRAREVSLRKILGSNRSQLIQQHLCEALIIVGIAISLSVLIVVLLLPALNQSLNKEMVLNIFNPSTLSVLLGLWLALAIGSGLYPAFIVSGVRPVHHLRSTPITGSAKSAGLRNLLVGFQTSVSIGLLVATAVIYYQVKLLDSADRGFDFDQLVSVTIPGQIRELPARETFRNEVEALPGVTSAAFMEYGIGFQGQQNLNVSVPEIAADSSVTVTYVHADHNYLTALGVEPIAGRGFELGRAVDAAPVYEGAKEGDVLQSSAMINERSLGFLGFTSPEDAIGKTIRIGAGGVNAGPMTVDYSIIGVIPDLNLGSLRNLVEPKLYLPNEPGASRSLLIRFNSSPVSGMSAVDNLWTSLLPAIPFEYGFAPEIFSQDTKAERDQASLLITFALIALAIGCLGLYGLASFATECRIKEVGIRKVLGASVREIVGLFLWQFSRPVLLANLVAWPVALYFMMAWLNSFPLRLNNLLLLNFCIAAGLSVLFVSWATAGAQVFRVARTNPIHALKHE